MAGAGRFLAAPMKFSATSWREHSWGIEPSPGQSGLGSSRLSLFARSDAPFNWARILAFTFRSEEHTSELQSLMRISYAVFLLKKKNKNNKLNHNLANHINNFIN